MNAWLRTAAAVLLATCAAACDDEGPSPQDECEMLMDTICDRIEACGREALDEPPPADFHETCVETQQTVIDCSTAVSVGASYPSCIDDLETVACEDFLTVDANGEANLTLPATCQGVIMVQ